MSHHCLCSMDKRGGGEIQNWSNEDESSGARFRWKTMTSFPVKEFRTRIFLRDGHHSFGKTVRCKYSSVLNKDCSSAYSFFLLTKLVLCLQLIINVVFIIYFLYSCHKFLIRWFWFSLFCFVFWFWNSSSKLLQCAMVFTFYST